MTRSEVKKLLSGKQNTQVAFATEKVTEGVLSKTLVALANARGGTFLLGVTQTGLVRGVRDADDMRDRVLWAALSVTPPLVLPIPEQIRADWGSGESRTVVAVQVPRGLPSVYAVDGRYLIRDGPSTRTLKASEVHQLMLQKGALSAPAQFETQVPPGATLHDLDWDRVRQYVTHLEQPTNRDDPPDSDNPPDVARPPAAAAGRQRHLEEILRQRTCLVNREGQQVPTAAGLLLFGKRPSLWMPGAEITAVRYPGTEMSDQFVREDIDGPLADQIRRAEAFLRANVPQQTVLEGLTHQDRPAYPHQVLREVLVNAVAHRDYAIRGEGIQIFIFGDRIRIYSPGRLPGHITVENIVEERFSRNPVIVQVLADLGFVERLGYGIDRIMRLLQQSELPAPLFEETSAGFQVILRPRAVAGLTQIPTASVHAKRWSHLELNSRQELALQHMVEQGGPGSARLTNREFQKLCPDVSAETIRRDLSDMVHKGILLRIGRKRATYYILKDADLA
jgi:ATP-dependent DNA helicase RecG